MTKKQAIDLIHKIRIGEIGNEIKTDIFTRILMKDFDPTAFELGYRQGMIRILHEVFDIKDDEYK